MTEQMTGRERVLAAFRDEPCDRPPLIGAASLANLECMQRSRAYFPYANLNSAKMAALAETSHRVLGFDSVLPYFGVTNEAGALGCEVDWGGIDRIPTVRRGVLRRLDEFRRPPDYLERRPLRTVVSAVALLKERLDGQAAIIGKVLGPLSLIFYLYGIQNTLNSLILEPETVVQLLGEVRELCIDFARAQIAAGADVITISEDAAGDLISRECYRLLVMETERRLFEALRDDAFVIFHLSCRITDRADLFRDTGFHALSFDHRNELAALRPLTGGMKLVGGVNNPVTLLNGNREDVKREVLHSLQHGVALVAPECAIPLRTPNENLLAMREAVVSYGKASAKATRFSEKP